MKGIIRLHRMTALALALILVLSTGLLAGGRLAHAAGGAVEDASGKMKNAGEAGSDVSQSKRNVKTFALADTGITVSMYRPVNVVPSSFSVQVLIKSVYELTEVAATVQDRTAALQYSSPDYNGAALWMGALSLSGLPQGSYQLNVTAKDGQGHMGSLNVPIILDDRPVVKIIEPIEGAVARPNLRISATCTDDGPSGCTQFKALVEDHYTITTVASSVYEMDQSISLAAWEGKKISLRFVGVDSRGQERNELRTVYVESNPQMTVVQTVYGIVLDTDLQRTLYWDPVSKNVFLHTGDTATDLSILSNIEVKPSKAFLIPYGALILYDPALMDMKKTYFWHNGQLDTLGTGQPILSVRGHYGVFTDGTKLNRIDLSTGEQVTLSNQGSYTGADVTENGQVVFGQRDGQIYRYDGSVSVKLTADDPAHYSNADPLIDGGTVIYAKQTCCTNITSRSIFYYKDGEEHGIAKQVNMDQLIIVSGKHYQARGNG